MHGTIRAAWLALHEADGLNFGCLKDIKDEEYAHVFGYFTVSTRICFILSALHCILLPCSSEWGDRYVCSTAVVETTVQIR
jgi:hypothetical protein